MSVSGGETDLKADTTSLEGGKSGEMESVRQKINGRIMSTGEELLCEIVKHTSGDVGGLRVFVLEHLGLLAEWMCSLFQSEMETVQRPAEGYPPTYLHRPARGSVQQINVLGEYFFSETAGDRGGGIGERKKKEKERPRPKSKGKKMDSLAECTEGQQQEGSPRQAQEDPQPPGVKENREHSEAAGDSTLPSLAVKSVLLSSTSTEHTKTQVDVEDDQLLSSNWSESDAEDSDWEETREEDDQLLSSSCSESDDGDSDDWGETSEEDDQPLSSHHSESDAGDVADWGSHKKPRKKRNVGGDGDRVVVTDLEGTMSFSCKDCGKMIPLHDRKRHIMIHTGEKPFVCTVCGKGFARTYHLKRHAMIHTGGKPQPTQQEEGRPSLVPKESQPPRIKEGPLQSPEDADDSTLTSLAAVKSVHDDANGDTVPIVSTSTEHVNTQAEVGGCGPSQQTSPTRLKFSCKECGKLVNLNDRKRHMMIHTGEKPFVCTVCGKGFIRMYHLKRHSLKSHVKKQTAKGDKRPREPKSTSTGIRTEKSCLCSYCGKMFTLKSALKRHMMIHTGEKPFACTVCDRRFIRRHQLKEHICGQRSTPKGVRKTQARSDTGDTGEKIFSCTVCGQGFGQKSYMRRHMRIHKAEKTICTICGEGFRKIKEHMKTHLGEKPFACTVCGELYSLKPNLKRHMRTHTGEKPFTCEICGKGFSRMDDIKRHQRVHSGERPFNCEVCGKGFSISGKLKRHMRTHTGEKPFTCTVCGKSCSQRGDLKRHMRTHTG